MAYMFLTKGLASGGVARSYANHCKVVEEGRQHLCHDCGGREDADGRGRVHGCWRGTRGGTLEKACFMCTRVQLQ